MSQLVPTQYTYPQQMLLPILEIKWWLLARHKNASTVKVKVTTKIIPYINSVVT